MKYCILCVLCLFLLSGCGIDPQGVEDHVRETFPHSKITPLSDYRFLVESADVKYLVSCMKPFSVEISSIKRVDDLD